MDFLQTRNQGRVARTFQTHQGIQSPAFHSKSPRRVRHGREHAEHLEAHRLSGFLPMPRACAATCPDCRCTFVASRRMMLHCTASYNSLRIALSCGWATASLLHHVHVMFMQCHRAAFYGITVLSNPSGAASAVLRRTCAAMAAPALSCTSARVHRRCDGCTCYTRGLTYWRWRDRLPVLVCKRLRNRSTMPHVQCCLPALGRQLGGLAHEVCSKCSSTYTPLGDIALHLL